MGRTKRRRAARTPAPRRWYVGAKRYRPSSWVLGAVLYGIAWPLLDGVNLTFLAWFAFVPLFIELERHERPWPFLLRAMGFMVIATVICCWWWFFAVPGRVMWMTWIGGAQEIALESVPLMLLIPLRRRLGFEGALAALVFVWPLWEWCYNHWELSMGYTLVAYSQAGNAWLVQYVDLLGAWAISGWVILFNVLLFRAWRTSSGRISRDLLLRSAAIVVVMVGAPAGYGGWRGTTLEPSGTVTVTTVHTTFGPIVESSEERFRRLERVVSLTDSSRYYDPIPVDLLVWPEASISVDWDVSNTRQFIEGAVDDWGIPLLAGKLGRESSAPGDTTRSNQAVLVGLGPDRQDGLPSEGRPDSILAGPAEAVDRTQTYVKRRLVPFFEGLPYYRYLRGFASVRDHHAIRQYRTAGESAAPLSLLTRDGSRVAVATPICHEQQFPKLWTEAAGQGAELFVHLSYESWFGELSFQAPFVNITRLRAIENRRSVVRASNGGTSVFLDAFGRDHGSATRVAGAKTRSVDLYDGSSFYSRHPNFFVLVCVVGVLAVGARYARRRSTNIDENATR